jgi:phage shock protein PspC (stress-responsive transcriptional regulator)
MNKVITINLNGNAYQLEEDGFEALRRYLDSASRRLEGNPDKAEIIADIEQSMGDKFRAVLGASKTVVVTKEVEDVIAEMGPVQDDASGTHDESTGRASDPGEPKEGPAAAAPGGPQPHRRLFRVREGAKIAGVCNGLAAYFGIEVTIVRVLFVFVALTFGAGALLYLIMMFVIPAAETPAEKSEAYGAPSTAEEFIRRAKDGYYGGMRTFKDKRAYREWKRHFKQEMRQHRRDFKRGIEQNVRQWSQDWRQHWGYSPHPQGSWIAGSFISLLITIVSLVGLCAVLSLILTGSVFSFSLPAGMPLWAGIVLLFLIIHILKWPLRAARHSIYYNGAYGPGYRGPGSFFCGTFWTIAIVLTIVWLANHHSPRTHEVLEQVRHESHQFVDSVRDWWNKP